MLEQSAGPFCPDFDLQLVQLAERTARTLAEPCSVWLTRCLACPLLLPCRYTHATQRTLMVYKVGIPTRTE